jgi:hypothetical protein
MAASLADAGPGHGRDVRVDAELPRDAEQAARRPPGGCGPRPSRAGKRTRCR